MWTDPMSCGQLTRKAAAIGARSAAGREQGGLIAYGIDAVESWRRAADYIARILQGAKPGELPIDQVTKLELIINLKTAKTLGLTVPQILLAGADEVIE
jgi:putative ABC transport system substrate-binding protein